MHPTQHSILLALRVTPAADLGVGVHEHFGEYLGDALQLSACQLPVGAEYRLQRQQPVLPVRPLAGRQAIDYLAYVLLESGTSQSQLVPDAPTHISAS